jgi:hypothetical protein
MTTVSDGLYQFGGMPVGGRYSPGKSFFVRPSTGADGNPGDSPELALKTLAKALQLCTANKGDTVYLISESNTASATTDYQSATLDWNKDGTNLIGLCSDNFVQQRARIAQLSTATGIDPLFKVSADNCYIANISVFQGVADATSVTAVEITGTRNKFENCTFSGIGDATQDVANASSLTLSGAEENIFVHCYIGLDTVARGTGANSEIRFESGTTRNKFENCTIATYAEAAGHQFLLVPANGMDRWNTFERCTFMNMPTGIAGGTTMTEAFDITAGGSPDGLILLKSCTVVGATDWEANTESARTFIDGAAATANTSGLAVLVEAT